MIPRTGIAVASVPVPAVPPLEWVRPPLSFSDDPWLYRQLVYEAYQRAKIYWAEWGEEASHYVGLLIRTLPADDLFRLSWLEFHHDFFRSAEGSQKGDRFPNQMGGAVVGIRLTRKVS